MPSTILTDLLSVIVANMGFLTQANLTTLIVEDRLRMVLVRCGSCRFICPAQDAEHLMAAVCQVGDYVRDISLPSTDPAMQAARNARAITSAAMIEHNLSKAT